MNTAISDEDLEKLAKDYANSCFAISSKEDIEPCQKERWDRYYLGFIGGYRAKEAETGDLTDYINQQYNRIVELVAKVDELEMQPQHPKEPVLIVGEPLRKHKCKYCGAMTSQSDEVCYKNPNKQLYEFVKASEELPDSPYNYHVRLKAFNGSIYNSVALYDPKLFDKGRVWDTHVEVFEWLKPIKTSNGIK